MSYVDKNLMNGENVIHRTKIHWAIFIPSILILLAGLVLLSIKYIGIIVIGFALVNILVVFLNYTSAEFAITNKRVIIKVGFIKRQSLETLLSKVEGIQVSQGVIGRIFNFGTIAVTGTGGSRERFSTIEKPMEFRKIVLEQIEETK